MHEPSSFKSAPSFPDTINKIMPVDPTTVDISEMPSDQQALLTVLANFEGVVGDCPTVVTLLASDELKNDAGFMIKVAEMHLGLLRFASEELKGSKDFIVAAIAATKDPVAGVTVASDALKGDATFMTEVLRGAPALLQLVAPELQANGAFVLDVIKNNEMYGRLGEFVDNVVVDSLMGDKTFILELMKIDNEMFSFLVEDDYDSTRFNDQPRTRFNAELSLDPDFKAAYDDFKAAAAAAEKEMEAAEEAAKPKRAPRVSRFAKFDLGPDTDEEPRADLEPLTEAEIDAALGGAARAFAPGEASLLQELSEEQKRKLNLDHLVAD